MLSRENIINLVKAYNLIQRVIYSMDYKVDELVEIKDKLDLIIERDKWVDSSNYTN